MTINRDLEKLHCDFLSDPECWEEKSRHLIQIAALLRPKVDEYWADAIDKRHETEHFVSAYLMICAYAIENLLKGILVAEHRKQVKDEVMTTKRLPDHLSTHDLRCLCKMARVKITPVENTELLDRLSRSAEWHARYPAPKRAHKIPAATLTFKGQQIISWSLHSSSDIVNIERTLNVLTRRLREQIAQPAR